MPSKNNRRKKNSSSSSNTGSKKKNKIPSATTTTSSTTDTNTTTNTHTDADDWKEFDAFQQESNSQKRSRSFQLVLITILIVVLTLLGVARIWTSWWNENPHQNTTTPTDSTVASTTTTTTTDTTTTQDKLNRFQSWLKENGAVISPKVTIASFPKYGGYGLMAQKNNNNINNNMSSSSNDPHTNNDDNDDNDDDDDDDDDENTIHTLEEMFKIPSTIISSTESILQKYKDKVPNLKQRLQHTLTQHIPSSSLVQQDIIIALHLMTECSLGNESFYKPYLDVLPVTLVPRLDTFEHEEELSMLQDDDLIFLARDSLRQLKDLWNDVNPRNGIQRILLDMIQVAISSTSSTSSSSSHENTNTNTNTNTNECVSFQSFHKYISITSSRAMVLDGKKYLTPMADMANYEPRYKNLIQHSKSNRAGSNGQSFTLYHYRNVMDQSISIRADREFHIGDQIFEDYGDVDNSLYLEAHGFIPENNPFHCAMIPIEYLVVDDNDDDNDDNVPMPNDVPDGLWDAMEQIGIIAPTATSQQNSDSDGGSANVHSERLNVVPHICVRADGSLTDDRAAAYIKVTSLTNRLELQQKCIDSIHQQQQRHHHHHHHEVYSKDVELMMLQCVNFDGHTQVLRHTIQSSARKVLNHSSSSLEDDLRLLEEIQQELAVGSISISMEEKKSFEKKKLALQFSISDKKVLTQIVNGEQYDEQQCSIRTTTTTTTSSDECQSHLNESATTTSQTNNEDLPTRLEKFNSFLETLDIPELRIEAGPVGDGMRLGAFATEHIDIGDTYISINSTSTISIDTPIVIQSDNADKESELINKVLERYRYEDENGGFQYLLYFLMYEKFVAKEKSPWYPYLELLPSVTEQKVSLPLFWKEHYFDFLAGSDLRKRLIDYQKKAELDFVSASLDYDVMVALKEHMTMENYFWAYSILNSRSIWLDGKRHLVPLLDLVNCSELRNNDGTISSAHKTILDKDSQLAVTKAAGSFDRGNQVFEDYAQPNYIYFLFHGFIMESNSHDCALWDLQIKSSKTAFCIQDVTSLHDVANYMRNQLELGSDDVGLANDVIDIVKDHLEQRIKRYVVTERDIGNVIGSNSIPEASMTAMKHIVKKEKEFFEKAYNDLKREYFS